MPRRCSRCTSQPPILAGCASINPRARVLAPAAASAADRPEAGAGTDVVATAPAQDVAGVRAPVGKAASCSSVMPHPLRYRSSDMQADCPGARIWQGACMQLSFWGKRVDRPRHVNLKEAVMPEQETLRRAERDKRQGKAPSTQAGEFVREEMHHIREGKHGARSTKQAIAIGLSKARRAGVKLPRPPVSARAATKRGAKYASRAAKRRKPPSPRRSRASERALRREGRQAASSQALSRQAKSAARRRSAASRRAAAQKAVRTKGPQIRRQAARKAARTRQRRRRSGATAQ
jgi:Family of unknown function (DUF6496)